MHVLRGEAAFASGSASSAGLSCDSMFHMDANQLIRRCNQKTPEELSAFQRQWVAWSEDGCQILASAVDLDSLFQEIDRKGLTRYVLDLLPLPEEGFLGETVDKGEMGCARSSLPRFGRAFR